jgi:hypothetical protein
MAAGRCCRCCWFWFFIRVDVAAEGGSPWRVERADLFILSLLASVTLALLWAALQAAGSAASVVFFGLDLLATTVLFDRVYWSEFAHMSRRHGGRDAGGRDDRCRRRCRPLAPAGCLSGDGHWHRLNIDRAGSTAAAVLTSSKER